MIPLPRDEVTPPVTKMYLVILQNFAPKAQKLLLAVGFITGYKGKKNDRGFIPEKYLIPPKINDILIGTCRNGPIARDKKFTFGWSSITGL